MFRQNEQRAVRVSSVLNVDTGGRARTATLGNSSHKGVFSTKIHTAV